MKLGLLLFLLLMVGFVLGLGAGVALQRERLSTVTLTQVTASVATLTETIVEPRTYTAFLTETFTAEKTVVSVVTKTLTSSLTFTTSVTYVEELPCLGKALCFKGMVNRIVDGDTLEISGVVVRLSLVDTPERGEPGFREATDFTAKTCPPGSEAVVDVDDGQPIATNRLLARVICGDKVLNEALLREGHAIIDTRYCAVSEFSKEPWALEYGC